MAIVFFMTSAVTAQVAIEIQCNVVVDLHPTFVAYWGGCADLHGCQRKQEERALLVAYDVMQQAFYIFEKEDKFRGHIQLVLEAISVSYDLPINTTLAATERQNAGQILAEYARRGSNNDTSPRHFSKTCLNVVLTHIELGACCSVGDNGAYLYTINGLASMPGYNTVSNNILATSCTFIYQDQSTPDWQLSRIIAHEMGHFFGASHDNGDQCMAPASLKNSFTDEYLMFSSESNDEFGTVSEQWSSCSTHDILSNIATVTASHPPRSINVCANQSMPHSCCKNGILLPAGQLCQPSQSDAYNFPCHLVDSCDGVHAECRSEVAQPDGTFCIHAHADPGFCMAGHCVHVNEPPCTKMYSNDKVGKGCSIKGHECVRSCDFGDGQGCLQLIEACNSTNSSSIFYQDCADIMRVDIQDQRFYFFYFIKYPPLLQQTFLKGRCIQNCYYGHEHMPCMRDGLLGFCSANGPCDFSSGTRTFSADTASCNFSAYGYSLFGSSKCNSTYTYTASPVAAATSNVGLIAGCVIASVVVLGLLIAFAFKRWKQSQGTNARIVESSEGIVFIPLTPPRTVWIDSHSVVEVTVEKPAYVDIKATPGSVVQGQTYVDINATPGYTYVVQ